MAFSWNDDEREFLEMARRRGCGDEQLLLDRLPGEDHSALLALLEFLREHQVPRARPSGMGRGDRSTKRAAIDDCRRCHCETVAPELTRRRRRSAASASAPKATVLGEVDAQSHALWGGGLPFASSPPPN